MMFYTQKISLISTKRIFQKIFLVSVGVLSPQLEALNLPSPEQTKHRPFFVNLFWTTGLEGAMPEMNSFSPTPEALKDIPSVELGGSSIGSKKTFEGITEFLQAAQKKNPQIKLIFTVDKLTYWANKQGFESLKEHFPDHFRVSFLEDFSELIKNKYPACHKVINEFGTKLRPNMSSNCLRFLSSCIPECLQANSCNHISAYFDVDNFVEGVQRSHEGKKNSLEMMMNSKLSKKQHIFTIKMLSKNAYIDTNALKINISCPKVKDNIIKIIETSSERVNKSTKTCQDYCNSLIEMILNKIPTAQYFSKKNQKLRTIITDPDNTPTSLHYIRSAQKFNELKPVLSPPLPRLLNGELVLEQELSQKNCRKILRSQILRKGILLLLKIF